MVLATEQVDVNGYISTLKKAQDIIFGVSHVLKNRNLLWSFFPNSESLISSILCFWWANLKCLLAFLNNHFSPILCIWKKYYKPLPTYLCHVDWIYVYTYAHRKMTLKLNVYCNISFSLGEKKYVYLVRHWGRPRKLIFFFHFYPCWEKIQDMHLTAFINKKSPHLNRDMEGYLWNKLMSALHILAGCTGFYFFNF